MTPRPIRSIPCLHLHLHHHIPIRLFSVPLAITGSPLAVPTSRVTDQVVHRSLHSRWISFFSFEVCFLFFFFPLGSSPPCLAACRVLARGCGRVCGCVHVRACACSRVPVRVHVCVCMQACACVCACGRTCVCGCVRVCARVHADPAPPPPSPPGAAVAPLCPGPSAGTSCSPRAPLAAQAALGAALSPPAACAVHTACSICREPQNIPPGGVGGAGPCSWGWLGGEPLSWAAQLLVGF